MARAPRLVGSGRGPAGRGLCPVSLRGSVGGVGAGFLQERHQDHLKCRCWGSLLLNQGRNQRENAGWRVQGFKGANGGGGGLGECPPSEGNMHPLRSQCLF